MKFYATCLFTIMILISCGDESVQTPYDNILAEPPFEAITDSIQKTPNDAGLYYRRGLKLKEQDLPEPALADFQKAWSLDKQEAYAVNISSILLDKDPAEAEKFIKDALRLIPSLFFELQLAEAYTLQQKHDAAIAIYDDILEKEPLQIDALMKKAELLDLKGDTRASLQNLEQAYMLAPFDVEISYALAYKYAEQLHPKALAISDSLIRMDSSGSHAEPYYFKGVYYANTGNKQKALELFDEAILHDYNFFDAHMEKGVINFEQGKYDEAYKTFEKVITISPSYANAYFWVAKVQEKQGLLKEARLNYQRAYGLDKSLTQAKQAADRLK